MEFFINIIICALLLLLVVQDFIYRAVHIGALTSLFIFCTISFYLHTSLIVNVPTLSMVLITFSLVTVYVSLKNKRFVNPFKSYIGFGDLLFLLAVTPMFYLNNFIIYLISGLILSIIIVLLLRKLISTDSIPLAGILSAYLIVFITLNFFSKQDLFYSEILIPKIL